MRFSANLGFLFTDLPLPDAVRAAARAGFDAVECHFPYETPPARLRAALEDTGLPLLSLNTAPGDSFGLAALPGAEAEARAAIDEAIAYAAEVGARMVHVMAGISDEAPAAGLTYRRNLGYACQQAAPHGLTILIEPINPFDVPGYHLTGMAQAARVQDAVGARNLKLMFDAYHVARVGDDVALSYRVYRDRIGHVQIAGVPDRGPPDTGTLDFRTLLPKLNHQGPIGAEYRDTGDYGWLADFRQL